MQLISADPRVFLKKKLPLKTWKNCPQKLLVIGPQSFFFSIANLPKISPNLIFCSIKMSPCQLLYNDFDWRYLSARLLCNDFGFNRIFHWDLMIINTARINLSFSQENNRRPSKFLKLSRSLSLRLECFNSVPKLLGFF